MNRTPPPQRRLEIGKKIPLAPNPENDYIIISDTALKNNWMSFIATSDSREVIFLDQIPTITQGRFEINGREYEIMV